MGTYEEDVALKYRTRDLIRYITQLYARQSKKNIDSLIKLTWYTPKTKIEACNQLFNLDCMTIEQICGKVTDRKLKALLHRPSGFIGFYHPYRNTAKRWLRKNIEAATEIYDKTLKIQNDQDIISISRLIESLPKISRADSTAVKMGCESYLTPLLACLDPTSRFPIVNKAPWVVKFQQEMGIEDFAFKEKVESLLEIIDDYKLKDSIDLDIRCTSLVKKKIRQIQKEKADVNKELVKRDDRDVVYFTKTQRKEIVRTHRKIERVLVGLCNRKKLKLYEGVSSRCKYDALIKKGNRRKDLLIEIKGSSDPSEIRLAIGQIFDYQYELGAPNKDLAILLPERPMDKYVDLCRKLDINVLWIHRKAIEGSIKI